MSTRISSNRKIYRGGNHRKSIQKKDFKDISKGLLVNMDSYAD